MSYYVHNFSPFAIEFWAGFGLRWYGLAYVTGFLVGWWLLIRMAAAGTLALDAKARGQFIFAFVLGVLIGGRVGFMLFYDFGRLLSDPLSLFAVWEGGMSSHGGFLGAAAACAIFSIRSKLPFLTLTDALCVITPFGLMLGRLANFINGELWGRISHAPWAVIFPLSAPTGTPIELIAPRHPSQLYEAALEGLFLFLYTQIRHKRAMKTPGLLTAEFIVLYCLVRILCELFREPDAALILGVSRGIFYSLLLIPVGVGLGIVLKKKKG